jgi:Mor family transcriptional regulator
MRYKNASHVLPDDLLAQVQKYAQGEVIYIPKLEERKKWGEGSGSRSFYESRNHEMREDLKMGKSIQEIATQYGLSYETTRKIVYRKT